MDNIISFKRYRCGYEEFDFSLLYRSCNEGIKKLPINVFMLEHKKHGTFLINTGCSRLLRHNPVAFAAYLGRHKLTFTEKDNITEQLLADGIDPICIRKVLLTHCSPECCGSLPLLPKYELISGAGVLAVLNAGNISSGIMKSTVPADEIPRRAAGIYKGDTILKKYYKWIYDVFSDGSVLAVDIAGHAKAMTAYYLPEKNLFFAADASVDETAINQSLTPTKKLLNKQAYPDDYLSELITLRRLHKENPEIQILFTHSEKAEIIF